MSLGAINERSWSEVTNLPRKTRYRKLTSTERLAQVNKNNIDLQNDFLDYLKSTHKSQGTIDGYRNDLGIFWVWVLDNLDNKYNGEVVGKIVVYLNNEELGYRYLYYDKPSITYKKSFLSKLFDFLKFWG